MFLGTLLHHRLQPLVRLQKHNEFYIAGIVVKALNPLSGKLVLNNIHTHQLMVKQGQYNNEQMNYPHS
jgi:hypothetical protein